MMESHLGIKPINDLMWAITLNITWIYLFSVSVFLSLFPLLSPQNLLTLVSYSSNFCILPPPKKKKKSVCSHSNSLEATLLPDVSPMYTSPKCRCIVCQFCPLHPCRLSPSNISFSSVDVFSLETLCDHLCIVFPIVPNPLSPLMTSI